MDESTETEGQIEVARGWGEERMKSYCFRGTVSISGVKTFWK